jgi:Aspartyl protease
MLSRRALLQSMAALPLLGHAPSLAQGRRVGGARIIVLDNRLWMQVHFGTRGPYAFIVDTGTFANLIKRDLARELRMREVGPLTGVGVGGAQTFTLYQGRNVMLGNIDIGNADFAGYDGTMIHREAEGAIASSILTVADSELDFEAAEWRIYPDGRGERTGYELLPSSIGASQRQIGAAPIHVDVAIAGRTYRLKVDTGAPGQVLLFARASRRSGLWNESGPYVPSEIRGIGGSAGLGRVVRVPRIGVGGIGFERGLVTLTDPDTAQRLDADGLLGLELLQLMNLSSDVREGRLWARRNARRPAPERYGLTGMWLGEQRGRLVVVALSPGSPAAEAGLALGDEILGVTLQQWIARVSGRPGTSVPFRAGRGGEERSGTLVLREFL